MSYVISLRSLLGSSDCSSKLNLINEKAKSLLSYTQASFPYYTPHGFLHSENVEEHMNWIIPEEVKGALNKYEIFFLIVSAWLHDWGMIGRPGEESEQIRKEHHVRTENYFETMYKDLGLTFDEARIIGRICKGHRQLDLHSQEFNNHIIGSTPIRTRFLAAILRIADEVDIAANRTPEIIYNTINPQGASQAEFEKHLSISGVAQLSEKHKIYINCVARDPKGAETLRRVKDKIQAELDAVKSILSQNGIALDVVELQMETKGFVDKPIGFEINKSKIIELLIGKHLYSNDDVALRELVQNSIDSCCLKKLDDSQYVPQIAISHPNKKTLVIEDNGVGMGYGDATKFLSSIGSSYYQSEEFEKIREIHPYDPISHFGIGLLSCFLIAENMIIETYKNGDEPCKFSISSIEGTWKYEIGTLRNTGTKITLFLKENAEFMDIRQTINKYFAVTEIPVSIQELNGKSEILSTSWSLDSIVEKFTDKEYDNGEWDHMECFLEITSDKYDLFLAKTDGHVWRNMVFFNRGIYVGRFSLPGLSSNYCIFINQKKSLIDLQISRENIIYNDKYLKCIMMISHDIFENIREYKADKNEDEFIYIMSDIIEDSTRFEPIDYKKIMHTCPFLYMFLCKAKYILVGKDRKEYVSFFKMIKGKKEINIYQPSSYKKEFLLKEVEMLSNVMKEGEYYLEPYRMPRVETAEKKDDGEKLSKYFIVSSGRKYKETCIVDLIMANAVELDLPKLNALPFNIKFATFGKIKPIVIVREPVMVNIRGRYSKYKAMTALWSNLIAEDNRREGYCDIMAKVYYGVYYKAGANKDPEVLVDASDEFISQIIDGYERIESENKDLLMKYFRYISFLPLAIFNYSNCIIFMETIDNLEKDISNILGVNRPPEILKRMSPNNGLFYLEHLNNNGIKFIT